MIKNNKFANSLLFKIKVPVHHFLQPEFTINHFVKIGGFGGLVLFPPLETQSKSFILTAWLKHKKEHRANREREIDNTLTLCSLHTEEERRGNKDPFVNLAN